MAQWQPMADNINPVDQFNHPDKNNNYTNSHLSHQNHTIPTSNPNTNINNNQI